MKIEDVKEILNKINDDVMINSIELKTGELFQFSTDTINVYANGYSCQIWSGNHTPKLTYVNWVGLRLQVGYTLVIDPEQIKSIDLFDGGNND